ncbi:MAG: TIGR00730 family Rossman fold protein [Paludibacter sp.]
MNIAVFCSSSNHIADKYKQVGFRLGQLIAESGDTLVYGGATGGLMDSVSEGAASKGGQIIGVIPQAVVRMNRQSSLPTQLISVETMSERKATMKELSEIFVVLPGSYGTLDEMLDIVTSAVVGEHKKPLIIVNQEGFYNQFLSQIELMRSELFIPVENYKPLIVQDINECMELITQFKNS